MIEEKYSSEYEIFYVTGISNLSLLAYNTFPYSNLFFDFIFWILPQYFIIMYPENKQEIFILLFNLINFNEIKIGNIFKIDDRLRNDNIRKHNNIKQYDGNNIKKYDNIRKHNNIKQYDNIRKHNKIKKHDSENINKYDRILRRFNHSVIGILRSYISLQVAICILGVDFIEMYPIKFTKSLSYGYKLMDIGVGSYLYNGGIMACKSKYKGILNLILLGILRLGVIRYFKLEVDIREYGKHSNFYFILAGTFLIYKIFNQIFYKEKRILSFSKKYAVKSKDFFSSKIWKNISQFFYKYIGYLILFIYYYITRFFNIDKLILSDDRSNFILENKESFFVIPSFVCLFVIMQDLSKILFYMKKNDKIETVIKFKILSLMKYSGIFYILYKINELIESPSRRLGNPTFIFFILYLHTFHLLVYVFVCLISKLRIYKAVEFSSRNMMTNFLLTNLLVLLVKKSINFSSEICHIVMLIYLGISFIIPPLLL